MEAYLQFENELGHRISVKLPEVNQHLSVAELLGRQGWCSAEVKGGLRLPLAQADDFEWALIGAREFTFKDDKGHDIQAVSWRGRTYKRREMAADPKKNLPAIVKYSRGGNDDDIAAGHVVEGEGNFRYVTLVTFKGGGHVIDAYRRGSGHRKALPPTHAAGHAAGHAVDLPPVGPAPKNAPEPREQPVAAIPETAAAAANAGPTKVTARRGAMVAQADERAAIKLIYAMNGVGAGMTTDDHADLRAAVAAVVDRKSPTTVLASRVPAEWSKFNLDELNEYIKNPIYIEDWWDERPFKPLPDPPLDAVKEAVERLEEMPPAVTASPLEKAAKPPEKASKMLVFAIEEQAKKLGYSAEVMGAHVSDATSGRTSEIKRMYAAEGRDLLAFLRSLSEQS